MNWRDFVLKYAVMKGIVFREFMEMVEENFGYETVDQIIEDSGIESKGIYTSVGTYPHLEFFKLAEQLSRITGISVQTLFQMYGKYVFNSFIRAYPYLIEIYHDTFGLLCHIEDTIHIEVLKLYPDAELPEIEIKEHSEDILVMIYSSKRRMGDFAEGLITGCLNYFKEKAIITKELLEEDQSKVQFTIKKIHG